MPFSWLCYLRYKNLKTDSSRRHNEWLGPVAASNEPDESSLYRLDFLRSHGATAARCLLALRPDKSGKFESGPNDGQTQGLRLYLVWHSWSGPVGNWSGKSKTLNFETLCFVERWTELQCGADQSKWAGQHRRSHTLKQLSRPLTTRVGRLVSTCQIFTR